MASYGYGYAALLSGGDWVRVARELGVEEQDINLIITEYPDNVGQQAMVMLRSDHRSLNPD